MKREHIKLCMKYNNCKFCPLNKQCDKEVVKTKQPKRKVIHIEIKR